MTVEIIQADARALPIPDASVDLVVTSPPYFALRSYTDGGDHYAGQLGAEATPAEYVANLIAATREMVRVLKPSGSLWVNLGDKYSTGNGGQSNLTALGARLGSGGGQKADSAKHRSAPLATMRPKSLIGVPWRYALACIDDLGLILRAEVIWSKPNGLPESVTDRVRRSHETWFHFTLEPRYFSAVDEIREAHAEDARPAYGRPRPVIPGGNRGTHVGMMDHAAHRDMGQSPLGKLPGSVWTIPTQPLTVPAELGVDHFAAFPMEWPRRLIAGWSPAGVCTACGEGRRPVAGPALTKNRGGDASHQHRTPIGGGDVGTLGWERVVSITGYVCACPDTTADTTPAVVLDPFGGTGTTALVAHALGRHGISVDMSADYRRLAEWRTSDPGQLAAALQVDKPPVQVDGQEVLL